MSFARAQAVADAVLYEGHMLYPYRASAPKNRLRWTIGVLPPGGAGGPTRLGCELLVSGADDAEVEARLRFLRPVRDASGRLDARPDEVRAPRARIGDLERAPLRHAFASRPDDAEPVTGSLELAVEPAGGARRLAVRVRNETALDPAAAFSSERDGLHALVSTHVLLALHGGTAVPPRDPPETLRPEAERCRSEGLWPILAGEPGTLDLVLCSPIVLDDHPAVAPESPGDFFDATEIDEMLALRVLTLSDAERRELAAGSEQVRRLLARVEALSPEALALLHGAIRSRRTTLPELRPGDRVRLAPQGRADVLDLVLAGRLGRVVSLERDLEDRAYVTVTVEGDAGSDLGRLGMPGHRFFFRLDEVERVEEGVEP